MAVNNDSGSIGGLDPSNLCEEILLLGLEVFELLCGHNLSWSVYYFLKTQFQSFFYYGCSVLAMLPISKSSEL